MVLLTAFEEARNERVARNNQMLRALVQPLAMEEAAVAPRAPRRSAPRASATAPGPPRRSARSEGKAVDYSFDALDERPVRSRNTGPPRYTRARLTLEEVEAMSEEELAKFKVTGGIDSGKGRRVQGGRVYDSAIGTTCHWCRQKTVELKVACTAALCSVGRLPVLFCGGCLANRHGEDLTAAMASGAWVCPRCRGGCGAGCCDAATQRMGCCNCGPCRKKVELSPTGQIAGVVYHAGYSNAHDYLCGSAAGLDQKAMDARRVAKGWGAWVLDPSKLPVAPASPVAGGQGAAARGSDESEEEEELPPGFASSAGRRAGTPVPRLVAPPPAGASRLSQVFQAAKAAPPAAVGDKRKADGETGAAGRAKRAAGRAN